LTARWAVAVAAAVVVVVAIRPAASVAWVVSVVRAVQAA
jgi:hypothetical protein